MFNNNDNIIMISHLLHFSMSHPHFVASNFVTATPTTPFMFHNNLNALIQDIKKLHNGNERESDPEIENSAHPAHQSLPCEGGNGGVLHKARGLKKNKNGSKVKRYPSYPIMVQSVAPR